MAKKRTVVKTKAADGSKSKVVTRKMKDGTTKVKSKTKSGGVVTKRKVTVGPKKTTVTRDGQYSKDTMGIGSKKSRDGQMHVNLKETKTSQSVKGKETVKNRNAKKGEVRKTKSKISGARTTRKATTEKTWREYDKPRKIKYLPYDKEAKAELGKYHLSREKPEDKYKIGRFKQLREKPETKITKTTPTKKTVKTKIKKRGRK